MSGAALLWGLWSRAMCLLFCKTNDALFPPPPPARVSRPAVFVCLPLCSIIQFCLVYFS